MHADVWGKSFDCTISTLRRTSNYSRKSNRCHHSLHSTQSVKTISFWSMLHRKYTVVVMWIAQLHDIIIIHRFHKYLNCCHNCSNQRVELKYYCSHQLPNNEARENHFYFAKHSIDDTRLGLILNLWDAPIFCNMMFALTRVRINHAGWREWIKAL